MSALNLRVSASAGECGAHTLVCPQKARRRGQRPQITKISFVSSKEIL